MKNPSSGFLIYPQTISVDFGLFIMYDNLQSATIYLQPQHVGTTCGMCGTCTNTMDDELTLPNGQLVSELLMYIKSFKTSYYDFSDVLDSKEEYFFNVLMCEKVTFLITNNNMTAHGND